MKYTKLLTFAAVSAALVSCTVSEPEGLDQCPAGVQKEITITATLGEPMTRTEREADGSVLWSPGDQISLFYGSGDNGGSKFTAQNKEKAKVVNFTGKIGVITGGNDVSIEDTYFWATYPYCADASCDGNSITTILPSAQLATADTFADDLFPSVGRSQGLNMGFYNICGGIKFIVSEADIRSVTLRSNAGEQIAGKITVGFDDNGFPVVTNITESADSVTLSAPAGQTLEVGKAYFMVFVPTVFQSGFSLTFDKGYAKAIKNRTSKTTIRRSVFGTMTNPDAGLEWEYFGINMPDANFRSYMIRNFDTDGNGILEQPEAAAVRRISVTTDNISSLTGIEYCTNLERLECYGSYSYWDSAKRREVGSGQLTSLDLSHNTSLQELYCYCNQLGSLDLPHNTALRYVDCGNNQLTSLDVFRSTSLQGVYCYNNKLSSLELPHNTELQNVNCGNNQLTSLDVSQNASLRYLSCYGNQLSSIDLTHNTELQNVDCGNNQLTSLDVSQNASLRYLYCYGNQLSSIDLTHNTVLRSLDCGTNQLTSLDLSQNTSLRDLHCYDNKLSSIDVTQNAALQQMNCGRNQLTSVDISQNTDMRNFWCENNLLTSLDISHNGLLYELGCGYNKLTGIDLSNNPELNALLCYGNRFRTLDVSKNTKLSRLECAWMNDDLGRNLLKYLYVAKDQAIPGVTIYRETQFIPEETIIVVSPEDGEIEDTIDEILEGDPNDSGEELTEDGVVVFQDDFEWVAPWAEACSAGDAVSTNSPTANAPNVFKQEGCAGFMDAFTQRGYTYLWGRDSYSLWSESLGEDNPMVLYLQANYLKLGKTDYNAALKLPAFEGISTGTDVVLVFDWAWQVTSSYNPDLMSLQIEVEGGGRYNGKLIQSAQSTVNGQSNLEWQHVKVAVKGIGPNSRIVIHPSSCNPYQTNPARGQNRWYLDNIKVIAK